MHQPPQLIGIAVVAHDGSYLVGTRSNEGTLPGYAEFPGGRCQPGEDPAECAIRECREETGLAVVTVEEIYRCRHAYPHGPVDLRFWLCRPVDARDVGTSHRGFHWVPSSRLGDMQFPEANRPVIAKLCSNTD